MTTVGNLGIGLLILIFLWIITLIIFVVGVKLQSNISWIALGTASAISILLLVIPTDKSILVEDLDTTVSTYDYMLDRFLSSYKVCEDTQESENHL